MSHGPWATARSIQNHLQDLPPRRYKGHESLATALQRQQAMRCAHGTQLFPPLRQPTGQPMAERPPGGLPGNRVLEPGGPAPLSLDLEILFPGGHEQQPTNGASRYCLRPHVGNRRSKRCRRPGSKGQPLWDLRITTHYGCSWDLRRCSICGRAWSRYCFMLLTAENDSTTLTTGSTLKTSSGMGGFTS